jgi:hypothetical protein
MYSSNFCGRMRSASGASIWQNYTFLSFYNYIFQELSR